MTETNLTSVSDASKEDLIRLMKIFLGDVFAHYGMWFAEAARVVGVDSALEMEERVLERYASITVDRLGPYLGLELEQGVPKVLLEKPREELLMFLADLAKTWVTGDGLWFQAVESVRGMDQAKVINDACWSHFAQMEAYKARRLLGLDRSGGLPALKRALSLRIYSSINAHEATWEDDGSLLFTMTECRVQSARRRKQMEDYPCKSAGIVEHTSFAKGIDPRIKTECVWCPPDRKPDQEFCAWRFTLDEGAAE